MSEDIANSDAGSIPAGATNQIIDNMDITARVSNANNPETFRVDVVLSNIRFNEVSAITEETIKACVCSVLEQTYKVTLDKGSKFKPIDYAKAICYGTSPHQSSSPEEKSESRDS